MDFIKEWTFSICLTVIIAVVFSYLTPKGNLSKAYTSIISLFICLSFFYPLANFDNFNIKMPSVNISQEAKNNTDRIIEGQIEKQVKDTLSKNNVDVSNVDASVSLNDKNEVLVDDVQIAVSSKYDLKDVENIVFDELGIVARVIYIGQ